MNDVFFPVETIPVKHPTTGKDTKWNHIVNTETDKVVSIMTNEYNLISNKNIIDLLEPHIDNLGGEFIDAMAFGESRFKIIYEFPKHPFLAATDDFKPRMVIVNSYDGSTKIRFMGGALKVICTNGMVAMKFEEVSASKHMGLQTEKELLIEKFMKAFNGIESSFKDLPVWKNMPLNNEHLVKTFTLFPGTVHSKMTDYITKESMKNYYDLYDLCTYTLTHLMDRNVEATHQLESEIYKHIGSFARNGN